MPKLLLICLMAFAPSVLTLKLPSLESLHLKSDFGPPQDVSNGVLVDHDGTRYDLSSLPPYDDLVSQETFSFNPTFTQGPAASIGSDWQMPIYRSAFANGTLIQMQKNALGEVLYVAIHKPKGAPNSYFVKTIECETNELIGFSDDEVNELDNSSLVFGDAQLPDDIVRPLDDRADDVFEIPDYITGDGTRVDCPHFKVVKVGFVYDSDFCREYGGHQEARDMIMMIVAAASALYEHDMCIKFQVSNIYTPDSDCSATSVFAELPRDKPCGAGNSESFIRYFRDWMNENRDDIGLDPEATFHALTGVQHQGTLGCGYVGTVCLRPDFAYGVDYLKGFSLASQSIILAHELGHNLGANHVNNEDAMGKRYIMGSAINNPNDGFSLTTIGKILGFLDSEDVTCDGIATFEPTASPTKAPTIPPSVAPTLGCFLERDSSGPIPCALSSQPLGSDIMFACFDTFWLSRIQPSPGCQLERQPMFAHVSFVSCQVISPTDRDISNDFGEDDIEVSNDNHGSRRRWLRKGKNKTSKKGNKESASDGVIEAAKDGVLDQKSFLQNSNDVELDYFSSSECSVDCKMIGTHVCFRSTPDEATVYGVTFSALYDGDLNDFEVEIPVRGIDQDPNDECIDPITLCLQM